jgi:hypothetical protein
MVFKITPRAVPHLGPLIPVVVVVVVNPAAPAL